MKIGLRLLLGYFFIVAVAGYFVLNIFVAEVKPGVRRTTEGMLVDSANLLAKIVEQDMRNNTIDTSELAYAFTQVNQQDIGANISGITKNLVEYRVYITDRQGKVIYDSSGQALGKDYSRWNDVYLTLRGKYGARSTRENPDDDGSSVMYVAAPIKVNGQIAGSLTVAKPNSSMMPIIHHSERRILLAGVLLLGIALLIGLGFVWWINRSISRLVAYAENVADGKPASLPKVGSSELIVLAEAVERMRVKLEGKAYVERYVYSLTHELKSPLAAIRGATEILEELPPVPVARRFLANIQQQNLRMQHLVDRMLLQASVESRQSLESQSVDLRTVINSIIISKDAPAMARNITLTNRLKQPASVDADEFLLTQAINNLVDNALDFSGENSDIIIDVELENDNYRLTVSDNGTGIPEYALQKIFDRFYSLARPNHDKSTGLGLSFVKEVVLLHQGSIILLNRAEGGVSAILTLPRRQKPI